MAAPETQAQALSWGTRLRRGFSIAVMSLALIALGLWITGHEGEALRAWRRLNQAPASLQALPGSRIAPRRSQRALGRDETVQACAIEASIAEVIERYEKQARQRALPIPGRGRPYLKVLDSGLGLIVWREAGGRRCGVAAYPLASGRGTRYLLFEGGRPAGALEPSPLVKPVLPLGIEAPAGSRALFDIRHDQGALAYYEVPRDPARLTTEMRAGLEAAGCRITSQSRGVLGFAAGERRGVLSLKPGAQPGTSALSLMLRGDGKP